MANEMKAKGSWSFLGKPLNIQWGCQKKCIHMTSIHLCYQYILNITILILFFLFLKRAYIFWRSLYIEPNFIYIYIYSEYVFQTAKRGKVKEEVFF